MSNDTKSMNDLRLALEEETLASLRTKAVKSYGLKITRNHEKDDIINEIMESAGKFEFAQPAVGELQAGWSRIKIHLPTGRSKFPFYFNCNAYQGYLPFNEEVDVPNKVVPLLMNAEENKPYEDEFGKTAFRIESSFPFSLIQQKPGPDPRPGLEKQRDAKIQPKRDFCEEFGYWPSDKEMTEFRRNNATRAK